MTAWGPKNNHDGTWTFRLWAPGLKAGVEALTLALDGEDHEMPAVGDGWFELTTDAETGSQYGFRLPGPDGLFVPDPASRRQRGDVHSSSVLVSSDYDWQADWTGRPWEETVLYECHTGTFTPQGTFAAIEGKLDHLVGLGVTALELMPIAQFGGRRGWGYDGVLLYCPHEAYGTPDELRHLVDAAHARGLSVFLDVVFNHFGPDGNYIGAYAPDFYHPERHTPWGAAIAYDRQPVRDFMIDNALYWLREYRIDGLRLDAIDSIEEADGSDIVEDIARAVRAAEASGELAWRRHLTTEDARNITRLHERAADGPDGKMWAPLYDGEWNDDFHNAAHVLMTGEHEGYYVDHVQDPRGDLLRCLESGFALQGQQSMHLAGARGEPSGHLPPTAFVNFIQNHDQTGNRAFGSRLTTLCEPRTVEVMLATLLLGPAIPLLFMGEEWGETNPYLFHTDFHDELADAVREGRRAEFEAWGDFADPELRATIPDPNDESTRDASRIDWSKAENERQAFVRDLLALRAEHVVPRLAGLRDGSATATPHGRRGFEATWRLDDGHRLSMVGNWGGAPFHLPVHEGRELFALGDLAADAWCIRVCLMDPDA